METLNFLHAELARRSFRRSIDLQGRQGRSLSDAPIRSLVIYSREKGQQAAATSFTKLVSIRGTGRPSVVTPDSRDWGDVVDAHHADAVLIWLVVACADLRLTVPEFLLTVLCDPLSF